MDELFSPFKQAQRLAGGTGLGLYSLAKRMEALNGYYGVRARADGKQGSNFWFAIPYKPDHISASFAITTMVPYKQSSSKSQLSITAVDQTFQPSFCINNEDEKRSLQTLLVDSSNQSQPLESSLNLDEQNISVDGLRLNILLVDDSHSILKVVGKMLRKHGHFVTEALNGEEALRVLEKTRISKDTKPFDVVVIDLQMPVMDGKSIYTTIYLSVYQIIIFNNN